MKKQNRYLIIPYLDPFNETVPEGHCLPIFLGQMSKCTIIENFVNCPHMDGNSECGEMKDTLEGCLKDGKMSNFHSFFHKHEKKKEE